MAINDPLGDLLQRIRNAQLRRRTKVSSPASKLRARVLDVLVEEGYIRGYSEVTERTGLKSLEIELKSTEQFFNKQVASEGRLEWQKSGLVGGLFGCRSVRRGSGHVPLNKPTRVVGKPLGMLFGNMKPVRQPANQRKTAGAASLKDTVALAVERALAEQSDALCARIVDMQLLQDADAGVVHFAYDPATRTFQVLNEQEGPFRKPDHREAYVKRAKQDQADVLGAIATIINGLAPKHLAEHGAELERLAKELPKDLPRIRQGAADEVVALEQLPVAGQMPAYKAEFKRRQADYRKEFRDTHGRKPISNNDKEDYTVARFFTDVWGDYTYKGMIYPRYLQMVDPQLYRALLDYVDGSREGRAGRSPTSMEILGFKSKDEAMRAIARQTGETAQPPRGRPTSARRNSTDENEEGSIHPPMHGSR